MQVYLIKPNAFASLLCSKRGKQFWCPLPRYALFPHSLMVPDSYTMTVVITQRGTEAELQAGSYDNPVPFRNQSKVQRYRSEIQFLPSDPRPEGFFLMETKVQNDASLHSPVTAKSNNSSVFSVQNSKEDFKFLCPLNFSAQGQSPGHPDLVTALLCPVLGSSFLNMCTKLFPFLKSLLKTHIRQVGFGPQQQSS